MMLSVISAVIFTSCIARAQRAKFVEQVTCLGTGMTIRLKDILPIPHMGMWNADVDGFPNCKSVNKPDVGGGTVFFISYADTNCSTGPKSIFKPRLVTKAVVTLTLTDDSGFILKDTLACTYGTLFKATSQTFKERSQNLIHGEIDTGEVDIEQQVDSGLAVQIDFKHPNGDRLTQRNVNIGDPLEFKIDVAKTEQISRILPENCYFSSDPDPNFQPEDGILHFVKKSCFAFGDGMVQHMLPNKMQINRNGTVFRMPFKAFYFSNYGQNLYVHCTILACIGEQQLCNPKDQCFGKNPRLKRQAPTELMNGMNTKEFVLTKYVIVEDNRQKHQPHPITNGDYITMQVAKFITLVSVMGGSVLILLIAVSCMAGRLTKRKTLSQTQFQKRHYYAPNTDTPPPSYTHLPTITSF